MNALPWGCRFGRGRAQRGVRETLPRGPPARTNGKGFIFPSLKSQKPCCCFLKRVEETCVSAESFLHLPVPSSMLFAEGSGNMGHIKVSAWSLGTQPLPAPPIPARQKLLGVRGGSEVLCFHCREKGPGCVFWIFQPLVTPQISVTS